ncbi:MAG: YceI family protein [Rubricoccaceae bacterium]
MPRFLSAASLAAALLLAACGNVGDAPQAEVSAVDAAERPAAFRGTPLPIDTAASAVEWTGAKVTGSHDGGFRSFDGVIYVDGAEVTGVDVRIDATSLYSDNADLTQHLLSPDFFEAETYPEARFVAATIRPVTEADAAPEGMTHMVTGTLTMRGQSNQVTFPARTSVQDGRATATADFIINRQDWGITYPGRPDDLIRNDVRVRINAMTAPATANAALTP